MEAPCSDSYWVVDRALLAGKYPDATLDALLAAGVRAFVDLTVEDELLPYADRLPPEVAHFRVAVPDMTCPREQQVREALDRVDAALANGMTYLHCRGGCGRTGVIVGAWLVRHGEEPQRALERVHELTRALYRSACPETDEQRAMVTGWARGR